MTASHAVKPERVHQKSDSAAAMVDSGGLLAYCLRDAPVAGHASSGLLLRLLRELLLHFPTCTSPHFPSKSLTVVLKNMA